MSRLTHCMKITPKSLILENYQQNDLLSVSKWTCLILAQKIKLYCAGVISLTSRKFKNLQNDRNKHNETFLAIFKHCSHTNAIFSCWKIVIMGTSNYPSHLKVLVVHDLTTFQVQSQFFLGKEDALQITADTSVSNGLITSIGICFSK